MIFKLLKIQILSFYFPEQVMALKELGLKVPKSTVIVNQACESQFLNPSIQMQNEK